MLINGFNKARHNPHLGILSATAGGQRAYYNIRIAISVY